MCLILVAYRYHPKYHLVLAANRDEFYSRPTEPAAFWQDQPNILAGKDLVAGGTWLGVTRAGRFAAITNYRDPALENSNRPSRGDVVSKYLAGTDNPAAYMDMMIEKRNTYNGFNLIVGDGHSLWHYSNISGEAQCLSAGFYGVSNHLLDTPWPKVRRSKEHLARHLKADYIDKEKIFNTLHDNTPVSDKQLPSTGVTLAWERILSPIFVSSAEYGTRCSTILTIEHSGLVQLTERTYLPNKKQFIDSSYDFYTSSIQS
ncbi:MAG: NRDE family protein [Firmicutes bacterium]|nr:NRDE family protein [Bacillota bacterium]